MSRIEQLISEIEMYIESCKPQAFSGNKKVIVEKDVIEEMLVELRMQTPDEIKKYQKIISNKDAILADAKAKAGTIIDDANKQTEAIINDHEITRIATEQGQQMINDAQARANQIIEAANAEAANIRSAAINYTDNQLMMLQNLMSGALSGTEARYNGFMKQLTEAIEVIESNRRSLNGSAAPAGYQEENK